MVEVQVNTLADVMIVTTAQMDHTTIKGNNTPQATQSAEDVDALTENSAQLKTSNGENVQRRGILQ